MNETALKRLAKPLIVLATLIWGTTFFIMKDTLDEVPVYFLLTFRFALAAGLLAVAFHKRWKGMDKSYLLCGGVMGLFLFCAYSAQTYGLMGTTPGKNAFLTACYCVIVPFLYWAVYRLPPDRYHIAAAFLCVTGIGLVSLSEDFSICYGDALTLLGGLFFALHIICVSKFSQGRDIFLLTVLQFAAAGILSAVGGLVTGGFVGVELSRPALGSLLYLTIAATGLALLFQNIGQKYTAPAAAAVLLALEAPFGVLFSMLFYHERPTVQMLLGFGCIFLSIICSETKFKFRVKPKEE